MSLAVPSGLATGLRRRKETKWDKEQRKRIVESPFRLSFSADGGRQKNVVLKLRNYCRGRVRPGCTRIS